MGSKSCRLRLLASTGIFIGSCAATVVWAGAILDGSTSGGLTTSYTGDFTIPHTDGTTIDSNLFHSFSDFNINTGESATFTGPGSIDNVITRVTGSGTSTFNGPLTSLVNPSTGQLTGANFYFINPNGLIFKEGANLNIGGAFYATTSDYVRLGQDGVYYADLGMQSVLTSSPPAAFGFLDGNPGTISFEGTQLVKFINLNPATPMFSFIGGDISLDEAAEGTATNFGTADSRGTFLTGNRVELVSVASTGEVVPTDGGYDIDPSVTLGNITIANGSVIDAPEVYIRGGQVVIKDSVVAPGFFFVADMAPPFAAPNGGSVYISGSEKVEMDGSGMPLGIEVDHPDPSIVPIVVTRFDGGPLFTGVSTFAGNPFPDEPAGNVPDVLVEGGDVLITNSAGLISQRFGPGEAGDITIKGDTVTASNGSLIVNLNTYAGAGGNIIVDANQLVLGTEGVASPFPGFNVVTTSSRFSPVFGNPTLDPDFDGSAPPNNSLIYAPELASADAGNITINVAGTVKVYGADIMTESQSYGKAGDITVNASDITLSREGGAFGQVATQSGYSGDAGQVNINATGNIELHDGYVVSASTAGTGTGGEVSLTAGENITIDGVHLGPGSSGIGSSTILPPAEVETQLANLYGFPDFQTMAGVFTGNPAASMFDVLGVLKVMGLTDLDGANPVAGNAGTVSITASTLNMNGNHVISSSTSSDGDGGAINIAVDSLSMANGAEIRSRSGLNDEGTGELLAGSGNGGDINIVAGDQITMESGSSISASSLGEGFAGNISVDAGNSLEMRSSSISTEALESDGGEIAIQAEKLVYMENSEITTSVGQGDGAGGNIFIDPDFVILQQSNILANAYGGPGGNITIIADNFLATPDSSIDASSELGIDGTVYISSPDDNVAEDLTVLPKNYLDVTSLISGRCDTSAGSSSLVDAGPGGQVIDPDGYLPGFAVAMDIDEKQDDKIAGSKGDGKPELWWAAYVRKQGLQLAGATCNF